MEPGLRGPIFDGKKVRLALHRRGLTIASAVRRARELSIPLTKGTVSRAARGKAISPGTAERLVDLLTRTPTFALPDDLL